MANGNAPEKGATGELHRELPELLGNILKRSLLALARDPEIRAAVRELREVGPAQPASLLTAGELAKALGVSVATVRRLDVPAVIVGDASSKRFDLAAVRAFLARREPKATTPAKRSAVDDVDVDGAVRRGGLRAVGGGRNR